MRSPVFILLLLYTFNNGYTQPKAGFEQYTYLGQRVSNAIAPIVHYQSNKKWYAEARYNYEDEQTFSLYAGKTFSAERKLSYSFTPMVGGMTGKQQGGLVGLNMDLHFKKLFFSSQSQYAVSAECRENNFFFSWSEAGYQPFSWMYTGLTIQQTKLYNTTPSFEPGVLVGFSVKQWTFPLYGFNVFGNAPYFVMGINWEWQGVANKRNKPAPLSSFTKSD